MAVFSSGGEAKSVALRKGKEVEVRIDFGSRRYP